MTRTSVSLFRTAAMSVSVMLFATSIAAAQTPPSADLSGFARELQGKNVLISADGARVRGLVTSVGATSIVLVKSGVSKTLLYGSIEKIEKSSHRVRNGTLIGLAAGAGFGLFLGGAVCEGCEPATIIGWTVTSTGIGAAAGAGIGALINYKKKDTDVLYDARRSTRTMAFAPIVSPTRKGVAFSMTWR